MSAQTVLWITAGIIILGYGGVLFGLMASHGVFTKKGKR